VRFRFDHSRSISRQAADRRGPRDHLEPKAFELLSALVLERPKALLESGLQERLWPGTFVAEANLSNLVAEIRAALGDPGPCSQVRAHRARLRYAFCGEAIGCGSAEAAPARVASELINELEAENRRFTAALSSRVPWLVAGV
jgi:hypothetical protein